MGAVFGGSSSTIFGSGGAGNFLTRLTTIMAVVFMLTSLTLTYTGARRMGSTVFDSAPLPEPPPLEVPAQPQGKPAAGRTGRASPSPRTRRRAASRGPASCGPQAQPTKQGGAPAGEPAND